MPTAFHVGRPNSACMVTDIGEGCVYEVYENVRQPPKGRNENFGPLIYLLHGLYRTLSHSQSEESQVRGGHKSVSEKPAVKFSF